MRARINIDGGIMNLQHARKGFGLALMALGIGTLALTNIVPMATADPVEDFYKGRQMKAIVGNPPGSDYDVWILQPYFLQLFYLLQKTYYGFSKLAYLYKYKRAKILIENDLCLNPINVNDKNVLCIEVFQES